MYKQYFVLNHHLKTAFYIYSSYLCQILKLCWWCETLKRENILKKLKRHYKGGTEWFPALYMACLSQLIINEVSAFCAAISVVSNRKHVRDQGRAAVTVCFLIYNDTIKPRRHIDWSSVSCWQKTAEGYIKYRWVQLVSQTHIYLYFCWLKKQKNWKLIIFNMWSKNSQWSAPTTNIRVQETNLISWF